MRQSNEAIVITLVGVVGFVTVMVLSQLGVTVTVVNPEAGDSDKDLMKEILDFFVSACDRFYGKRGAQRIKEKIKEGIE